MVKYFECAVSYSINPHHPSPAAHTSHPPFQTFHSSMFTPFQPDPFTPTHPPSTFPNRKKASILNPSHAFSTASITHVLLPWKMCFKSYECEILLRMLCLNLFFYRILSLAESPFGKRSYYHQWNCLINIWWQFASPNSVIFNVLLGQIYLCPFLLSGYLGFDSISRCIGTHL